jgi:hypothetical protein
MKTGTDRGLNSLRTECWLTSSLFEESGKLEHSFELIDQNNWG